MIGPIKKLSVVDHEELLDDAMKLEELIDRTEEDAQQMCEKINTQTREFTQTLREYISQNGLENYASPRMENTCLTKHNPSLRIEQLVGVNINSHEDGTRGQLRPEHEAWMDELGEKYAKEMLTFREDSQRLQNMLNELYKQVGELTVVETLFTQRKKRGMVLLYVDSGPEKPCLRVLYDRSTTEITMLNPDATSSIEPDRRYSLERRMKDDAKAYNANVYLISNPSTKIGSRGMISHVLKNLDRAQINKKLRKRSTGYRADADLSMRGEIDTPVRVYRGFDGQLFGFVGPSSEAPREMIDAIGDGSRCMAKPIPFYLSMPFSENSSKSRTN
jgi:hypothetical protein